MILIILKGDMMKFKKSILFSFAALLVLCLGVASAYDPALNETVDVALSDEELSVDAKHSIQDELEKESNDEKNYDEEVLRQTNEVNLSSEGEFIDVNDAYVYLNQFRSENGVWQWNSDDSTKTVFNTEESNQLKPLARDLALEQTAKIRAKELVEKFAHERPNGTTCFTAFPDGLSAMGENIAMGQTSCWQVTDDWKETNDPYSGQGHRRNMLNANYNAVGIAGYKLNGVIYWVQDFGYSDNIKEGTINYPNANNANSKNTKTAVKITAKKKTFKSKTKIKKYTITLKAGKKAVKKVKLYLKIKTKTFKATTNKHGKATFKIKFNKKGTFKTKIIFKGNKNYKATTKTVKIKIK